MILLDIINMINLKVMKCYKNALKPNNLKNNLGFFINFGVMFLFFIIFIIFISKSWGQLYIDIKEIILAKRNNKFINNKNKNNIEIIEEKKKIKKSIKCKKQEKKIISNNVNSKNILSKKKIEFKSMTNYLMMENDYKNILEYKDYELNSLNFKIALKEDKRNLLQYYISTIKINNLLLFSFFPVKDYNSMIIKNLLFFFFFVLNLSVNALFFNDDTMHKIYIDEGKYNLIYQIPQIIYSSIISGIVNILIKYLSLSQDNIMDLKHANVNNNLERQHKKLLFYLKIKFTLFFMMTILLLLFFCFYISCFCGIYRNTQMHLLKDSVLGFVLSLLDPFWQILLIGIIRICALRNKNEYLYKFYLFLENLC